MNPSKPVDWKKYAIKDDPEWGAYALKMQQAVDNGWDMFGLADKKWIFYGKLGFEDKEYTIEEIDKAMAPYIRGQR